ncbi:MAG: L-aspartate oxidase [Clostridium sp.]
MDINTDILIIGSGIAGLYAALNLSEKFKILLVTKETFKNCNSYLAQGGISTALNINDETLFVNDTLKAGNYKNNITAVKTLVHESIPNIYNLENLGVKFDKINNSFDYTREGCHSLNRIVHCKDSTGREVFNILKNTAVQRQNITMLENTNLVDILSMKNKCFGGIFIAKDKVIRVNSSYTILACGGIGGLFNNSTNDKSLKGTGISIALRHNVKTQDLNYIQFHPTALYENNCLKSFLISESLRGEGAFLYNAKNKRFINELLPRNIVSQAIKNEINNSNLPYVYLDISYKSKDFIINRFPLIYTECIKKGIDITKEPIPVCPAQHYFMGGIKVNLNSETSMKNLFAIGEVSCTGVHGENRLASNSLLEALVFSKRLANLLNTSTNKDFNSIPCTKNIDYYRNLIISDEVLIKNKLKDLRSDIKNELVCS